MIRVRTSMAVWDDESEPLPDGIEPPNFTILARDKEELVQKLLLHFEYCYAVMKHDGVDGIDYRAIAKKELNKRNKRHYGK